MARIKIDKHISYISNSEMIGVNVRLPHDWHEVLKKLAHDQSIDGKNTTVSDLVRMAIYSNWINSERIKTENI